MQRDRPGISRTVSPMSVNRQIINCDTYCRSYGLPHSAVFVAYMKYLLPVLVMYTPETLDFIIQISL